MLCFIPKALHRKYGNRFLPLCWLLLTTTSWAQTPATNYIISRTYKQANLTEDFTGTTFSANSVQAASAISYFDGLGKPTQQVMAFGAASKGDIISITEYDNLYRPFRTFLPTPFATNGGLLQSESNVKSRATTYYTDGVKVSAAISNSLPQEAFATQTFYESSPLNRVTGHKAPGATNSSTQVHGVNSTNEVKYYQITSTGLTNVQLQGNYAAGALTWHQNADENGGLVTQFDDRNGRTVLKRVKETDDTSMDTYYVYDEKGQLRAVLQPKYQKLDGNTLEQSAFLYRYDDLGRLVEKKVPGSAAVQMAYKGTTNLTASTTDGKGQTFYYQYDNLNRQVETGICTGACDVQDYTSRTNKVFLQKNYYDTYPTTLTTGLVFFNDFGLDGSRFYNNDDLLNKRIGLLTGTETRILLPNSTVPSNDDPTVRSVIYYDNKYRIIQTVRQLYGFNSNAYERVSYLLAFDGKPEQAWTTQGTGSVNYKLAKTYTYDHADRVIRTDHVLYEGGVQKKSYTHVENLYNEVGQLATKSLHEGMQVLNYKYTPRGWLGDNQTTTGQSFSLGLLYQDNGNITSQSWVTKNYSGGMGLSYDKASRLTGAVGSGGFSGYSESSIQYDPNGNLMGLTRTFDTITIDRLSYQYHGNLLHRIDDANDNRSLLVKGFLNGLDANNPVQHDDELGYDGNGNLIRDDNRGVTAITYNVLNLPRSVTRNGRTVLYTYDATGTKHKSEAPDNVNTFYAGTFEYRAESSLLRIGLEEGQLIKDNNDYVVQYYLRDHLGNVRSVLKENGDVIQETEYYAYGLPIQRSGIDKNKYLYNGKEKQAETEWLDYGARMYDPTIGQWMVVDPLTEKSQQWSSYSYVNSNPILFVDPDGMESQSTHTDKYGNVIAVKNDGNLGIYRHNGNREETQKELNEKYSSINNQSAGGEYMGQTLHALSFANHNKFNEKGTVIEDRNARISFNNAWAKNSVNSILRGNPSAIEYAIKARSHHTWDLKTQSEGPNPSAQATFGSIIFENNMGTIYASARDAGNFAAGAVAARSNWPTSILLNGFGAYNIAQNPTAAGLLFVADYSHLPGPFLSLLPAHGEDAVSFMAISAGLTMHNQFFPPLKR